MICYVHFMILGLMTGGGGEIKCYQILPRLTIQCKACLSNTSGLQRCLALQDNDFIQGAKAMSCIYEPVARERKDT